MRDWIKQKTRHWTEDDWFGLVMLFLIPLTIAITVTLCIVIPDRDDHFRSDCAKMGGKLFELGDHMWCDVNGEKVYN